MSDIIIKGIEMPTERESFNLTIKYNGLVFDTETGIQIAEAQEVPQHGRCIDADALIKKIPVVSYEIYENFRALLESAPTIIQTEEENET